MPLVGSPLILSGGVVINDVGSPHANFRVETNNKTHAIFVDAGDEKIFFLSGSSVTGADGKDVAFFVSGTVGSRGTDTGGAAVFGGDVVHSGSVVILDTGGTDENLKLVRGSSGNNYVTFEEDSGVNVGQIYANSANLFIKGSASGNDVIFRVGSKNVIRMDGSTERIGIGNDVSSPMSIVHISGTEGGALRVDSGDRSNLIVASGSQVLILSGGSPLSTNFSSAQDVALYISGSRTLIGGPNANTTGRNSGERTNTVFGGDVIFSGSIYGTSEPIPGEPALHLKANIVEIDALKQVAICDSMGGSPGFGLSDATDVFFGVSGSIGGKDLGIRGVSVFGGDTIVSGSLYVSPTDATKGIVIISPNGTKYRLTVDNAGNLGTSPG